MGRFEGRTAVVTGAGGGIGRACALLLAEQGARVALMDISAESVELTAEALRRAGGNAAGYLVDVTDTAAVDAALARAEEDLGPVTLAAGAHGIVRNHPFLELPAEDWDATMAVNLKGMFVLLQRTALRAVAHGGGTMVAVSSVAGRGPRATCADYAASKAGVISLVRSAALSLAGHGIRVNAVCPGVVDTEMTRAIHRQKAEIEGITAEESFARQAAKIPLGRIETPQEIAGVVSFLLSDDSSYVTGQALNVCGGLEMD
ncbi:SDR family NAD(P)-dependent oxidoreductase [Streptomyces sp. TS71-3]|uniref:SDR family NAD(P)-dependent oxidoreductase n=1 Tax=Streptomyces sp. TS71-3 TaxID=2733862 RepID=UPI001B1E0C6E|nr:SDR family NAD(P)-dependent oxidoreductase [Streptomyces sp. TS71-3]GHJ40786.1 diacetyl reductase [Streptomyces sp. TS71-3]